MESWTNENFTEAKYFHCSNHWSNHWSNCCSDCCSDCCSENFADPVGIKTVHGTWFNGRGRTLGRGSDCTPLIMGWGDLRGGVGKERTDPQFLMYLYRKTLWKGGEKARFPHYFPICPPKKAAAATFVQVPGDMHCNFPTDNQFKWNYDLVSIRHIPFRPKNKQRQLSNN